MMSIGKKIGVILFAGVLLLSSYIFVKTDTFYFLLQRIVWKSEFLTPDQAIEKWGEEPFDAECFISGDLKTRSRMAVFLLRHPRFLAEPYSKVREALGDSNGGYYFYDAILTYQLEDGYSLVFTPSQQQTVDRILIWKNH